MVRHHLYTAGKLAEREPTGGGFSLPANPAEFDLCWALTDDLDSELSIAFLEYCAYYYFIDCQSSAYLSVFMIALTPETPFPAQLRQAAAALNFLFCQGVSPANMMIGGDSAGGNLALQLISHIAHPLPGIDVPKLSSPLGGALLISPTVYFGESYPSYTANAGKDILTLDTMRWLFRSLTPGITEDLRNYVEPSAAPAEWWTGLDKVASRVIVTVGEDECQFDSIAEFARVLQGNVSNVEKLVEEKGAHCEFMMAFGVGEGRERDAYHSVVAWMKPSLA